MTPQERIEQLKNRITLIDRLTNVNVKAKTYVQAIKLKYCILGQIQALEWVESEREKEFIKLGEVLKEMAQRNGKELDISPKRIKRELNTGGVFYKPTTEKSFDGSKVDFMTEDEYGMTSKGNVKDRWDAFKNNTTGLDD